MELEKLTGEVSTVIYSTDFKTFKIFTIEDKEGVSHTVLGNIDKLELGDYIEATGSMHYNQDFGKQFKAKQILVSLPKTTKGMHLYLQSTVKGLGPKTASKIVDAFKDKTLDIIRNSPEELKKLKINPELIKKLQNVVEVNDDKNKVMLFLINSCGLTIHAANSLYNIYNQKDNEKPEDYKKRIEKLDFILKGSFKDDKSRIIPIIQKNPYALIEIAEYTFKKCDILAQNLGLKQDSKIRINAGIEYALKTSMGFGNTVCQEDLFKHTLQNLFGLPFSNQNLSELYDLFIIEKKMERVNVDGFTCIISKQMFDAEKTISKFLKDNSGLDSDVKLTTEQINEYIDRMQEERENFKKHNIIFSQEQREAIINSIKNKISVITGGPGTGKTTILDGILEIFKYNAMKTADFKCNITLLAPTGKAVKRIIEKSNHPAKTIHKYLLEQQADPSDVIIIDEASMIDTELFAKLFDMIDKKNKDAHVIIVGDINQLPSIGAGKVLEDIINSKIISTTKLTKPQRAAQTSPITMNAYKINEGKFPDFSTILEDEFVFIETNSDEDIAETILKLVESDLPNLYYKNGGIEYNKSGDKRELNITEDIQILSPMNKTIVGNEELNEKLKPILNKSRKEPILINKVEFKEGDKIINNKNSSIYNIFNGDVGYIAEIHRKSPERQFNLLDINFTDQNSKDNIVVIEEEHFQNLKHAYSLTIHKSQGSEYPIVIIPMTTTHNIMLDKKLLYTAVTRAKKKVVLVGSAKAIQKAVTSNPSEHRRTGLFNLLIKQEENGLFEGI